MGKVLVKIHSWESSVPLEIAQDLDPGDIVVVEMKDETIAAIVEKILGEKEVLQGSSANQSAKFLRKANLQDINTVSEQRKKAVEAMAICHKEVKKADLPMKIVGTEFSLDGGSITVAFIADGRVDFRDLVKNLSKHFQRSVRLHQIGARDESRQEGGYGICGRELCCVRFKGNLPSITSEMAKIQQIAHRGSERISGLCGRLMCCLSYEADQYREMLEKYPKIGDSIKHHGKQAVVRDVNILSGDIRIELPDKSFVIIKQEEIE